MSLILYWRVGWSLEIGRTSAFGWKGVVEVVVERWRRRREKVKRWWNKDDIFVK